LGAGAALRLEVEALGVQALAAAAQWLRARAVELDCSLPELVCRLSGPEAAMGTCVVAALARVVQAAPDRDRETVQSYWGLRGGAPTCWPHIRIWPA
jgi:hypothetical protein